MSAKAFVDTNVLIYAHDVDAGDRNRVAKKVVAELSEHLRGAHRPPSREEHTQPLSAIASGSHSTIRFSR
jgi:hypothetical protein